MHDAVEQAYRDHAARLLALLVTRLRRFDVAEDCLQDAFVAAARTWPATGAPDNPAAWLHTAARRRALDRLRREDADRARLPLLITDVPAEPEEDDVAIADDRLRMLFACCHPALRPESQTAMMLRFAAGLSTAQIARLFLVPEPTMSARLTRAKRKMALAGIPLRTPPAADLPARLDGVLTAIYLLFSEGYRATSGPELTRPEPAAEAIRLGYLLGELVPGEDRVVALLALMVLQHARRDARTDADGRLVPLPDQDRTRWRHDEIARGLDLVRHLGPPASGYHLQALIAAEHARGTPDWPRIAALYADLDARTGSPVVRLNRAVAVAEAGSPEAAWKLLDGLEERLPDSHLFAAVRAELLLRQGRKSESAANFTLALQLARTDAERAHLRRRLADIG